jgi:hypothetical protein
MTAPTKAGLAWAAAKVAADHPDVAKFLLALTVGRTKKPKTHTAWNLRLADAYMRVAAMVADGVDEVESLAIIGDEMGIAESVMDDVWAKTRTNVNSILRERGQLYKNQTVK